jgi:hypothetical protein
MNITKARYFFQVFFTKYKTSIVEIAPIRLSICLWLESATKPFIKFQLNSV